MAKQATGRVTGINNLTDVAVRKLAKPGLYADGGKLYLSVRSASQKSWVFVYQWGGKRKEMGLGSLQDVGLSQARELRKLWAGVLADGHNPIDVRAGERAAQGSEAAAAKVPTFAECAKAVIRVKGPTSEAEKRKWLQMMAERTGSLAKMLPADIGVADVLAALGPYWHDKPRAADRMRHGIERVLDWAQVQGFIPDPWSNPARLKGNLEWRLEQREDTRGHHASIPYKLAGKFMAKLRAGEDANEYLTRQAAEFCILTATRRSEAAGARLTEFDLEDAVWVIPAERMKMRRPHRIPLSPAALAIVERCMAKSEEIGSPFLFPSFAARDGHITPLALSMAVRSCAAGVAPGTIHGFRATFKDWSLDVGGFSDALGEECLAHIVGSAVRNAYRRDDSLEGRRAVMNAWADFVAVEWADNVTSLGAARRAAAA